jgi:hypothetical protein
MITPEELLETILDIADAVEVGCYPDKSAQLAAIESAFLEREKIGISHGIIEYLKGQKTAVEIYDSKTKIE